MFEYLMPALHMRSYPGTLLHSSMHSVVAIQRRYAQQHGVPWGISEAAYAERDTGGRYRYKACGVPHCGLKRGLDEDLVIAPYATAACCCRGRRE